MANQSEVPKQRKVGKAAVLPTAPAYSWAKSRDRVKDDPGPGPGEYDCSIKWSKGIGFGSSARYRKDGNETPSPQEYRPTDAVMKSNPGWSFRTKSPPEHLKSKTPGPGRYEPSPGYDAVKPGTPAYSLTARCRSATHDTTPAPNEYDAGGFRVKEVHGASLKFRHSHSNLDPGPGPQDYADVNMRRPASEGKTFGASRETTRPDNFNPGPGEYQPDESTVKQRHQAWTVPRSARDVRDVRGVPGPGTYLHEPAIERDGGHGIRSDSRSAPAFTVAGKPAAYPQDDTPGPVDYGRPKDPRLKTPPAYSFHGVHVKDSTGARAPGPGAYTCDSAYSAVRASAPVITLGAKFDQSGGREQSPGPAEYTLSLDRKPAISLKFRHETRGKDTGPSPVDYADKDIRKIYMSGYSSKGYTFGHKLKTRMRDQTPGPEYAIGCTTLGIAAAIPLPEARMNQIAVL